MSIHVPIYTPCTGRVNVHTDRLSNRFYVQPTHFTATTVGAPQQRWERRDNGGASFPDASGAAKRTIYGVDVFHLMHTI